MKKLLILFFLFVEAYAQDAPTYTTNFRLRKYTQGQTPTADSLNANWTAIDSYLRDPGYITPDSVIIGASASNESNTKLYVNGLIKTEGDIKATDGDLYLGDDDDDANLWLYNSLGQRYYRIYSDDLTGARYAQFPDTSGIVALTNAGQDFTAVDSISVRQLKVTEDVLISDDLTVTDDATADSVAVRQLKVTENVLISDDLTVTDDVTADSLAIRTAKLTGKIATYNNVATEGYGVPAIVDYVTATGQEDTTAWVAATNTSTDGLYRVSVFVSCSATDGGNDSVRVELRSYRTDTYEIYGDWLVLNNAANTKQGTYILKNEAGYSIEYRFLFLGEVGTEDTYEYFITTERLN